MSERKGLDRVINTLQKWGILADDKSTSPGRRSASDIDRSRFRFIFGNKGDDQISKKNTPPQK